MGVRDSQATPVLIDMLSSTDYIIADRGYVREALREQSRDKMLSLLSQGRKTTKQVMMISIGVYTNTNIELKIYLLGSSNTQA